MNVPLTPLEFARRARSLYGDREAVVDGPKRFTYREFFERCDRWSTALQGLGVGRGDRVAYISPNTHTHLESFYAVPQIGAVLVPINFRLQPHEFEYILNHSGAKVACVHPDHVEAVEALRDSCPSVEHFVVLDGGRPDWLSYEELLKAATATFDPVEIDEQDLLSVNYTSGTTSRPKGVMITHRNVYMNVVGELIHIPMTAADNYLWTLPMFHANGWTYPWTVTAVGAKHICLKKVDPRLAFDLIGRESVTMLCAAPTVLIALESAPDEVIEAAPAGVRVITAGAPPAANTILRIEEELGWELIQAYGLTETAPFITVCEVLPEHLEMTPEERSVIKARQGVELVTSGELRVVDEKGNDVPRDGETLGEIIVRGNVVMEGYWDNPEATAEALRGGFFHSEDAAVVHPDGYVEIRDRFKDVIISGGENISSVEVESALIAHPAVQEVAIVGLPHEKWGETPHAFVVLEDGETATEGGLIEYAREHLAHFKAPTGVTFVDELPKTATGKIQKFVLRDGKAAIATQ